MLFMAIFTWEPEKRNEVFKRKTTEKVPEGVKLIGEWIDLQGGRIFRLIETDDPKAVFAESVAWNDLGKVDCIPVMETKEVLKLLPKSGMIVMKL